LSGLDTKASYAVITVTDRIVPPGTETGQNVVPSDDGASASSAPSQPATLDLPNNDWQAYKGLGYSAIEKLGNMGTYGNYGGPGWTSGTRDPTKMHMLGGKYIVDPIDAEDALYKLHDEAVYHAKSDRVKSLLADKALGDSLRALPTRSNYGTIASWAF